MKSSLKSFFRILIQTSGSQFRVSTRDSQTDCRTDLQKLSITWICDKPEVEGHTINTERRKINFFFNRKSKDYNFYGIFGFEHKSTENGRKLIRTFHVNHAEDDGIQENQTDLVDIGSGNGILKKKKSKFKTQTILDQLRFRWLKKRYRDQECDIKSLMLNHLKWNSSDNFCWNLLQVYFDDIEDAGKKFIRFDKDVRDRSINPQLDIGKH